MLERDNEAFDAWIQGWESPAPTTYQGSSELAFQRWFKFKEAFAPSLVEDVIASLKKKPTHILDCCGGSGTTGVVAQFLGIDSTLIEVNPFLADLIDAKLGDYRGLDLPSAASRVLRRAELIEVDLSTLRSRLPPTFIEPGVKERWIFSTEVARTIEALRISIDRCADKATRRLFLVALASILIEVSNVRIDGKGRRYRQNWQLRRITPTIVTSLLTETLRQMIEDIYRHAKVARAPYNLIRGDARKEIKSIDRSIDLVLFSPPYPNSFDYTDIYNVEVWMLGYFSNSKDNTNLRQATMRSHVQCSWTSSDVTLSSKTLRSTLIALNNARGALWDRRIPQMVHDYFCDMQCLISESAKRLSDGGRIAMVVGNSSYANILIDVPQILCELSAEMGLETISSKSARAMRSSIQQGRASKTLAESLVVLGYSPSVPCVL